jgi:hypothetical protein
VKKFFVSISTSSFDSCCRSLTSLPLQHAVSELDFSSKISN